MLIRSHQIGQAKANTKTSQATRRRFRAKAPTPPPVSSSPDFQGELNDNSSISTANYRDDIDSERASDGCESTEALRKRFERFTRSLDSAAHVSLLSLSAEPSRLPHRAPEPRGCRYAARYPPRFTLRAKRWLLLDVTHSRLQRRSFPSIPAR